MRLKPLPDSVPVLESLLRAAEKWLDANNHAHRVADRFFDWDVANTLKRSLPEALALFDKAAFIDDLFREADLHRPPCMDFVHYVDWPFAWEPSDDWATSVANLVAESMAYKERRAWMSARYEHIDRHLKMDSETIFLRFTREVRAKLEDLARRQARGVESARPAEDPSKPASGRPRESPNKTKKKRDQGKYLAAYGAYMAHIASMAEGKGDGEPPTAAEVAKQVDCSKTTAWRAIKDVERIRTNMSKNDASARYTDHTTDGVDDD